MRRDRHRCRLAACGIVLALASSGGSALAAPGEPFPEPRPFSRAQAAQLLPAAGATGGCLTPQLHQAQTPGPWPTGTRRALGLLMRRGSMTQEQIWQTPYDASIRYAAAETAADRIAADDADLDGRPDVLEAVVAGMAQARALLSDRLGLELPRGLEVWMLELGETVEGYALPRAGAPVIVLDATPSGGPEQSRRSALHQYVHAVAFGLGPSFPVNWAEALATWAPLATEGEPAQAALAALSLRAARLDAGLAAPDLDLAAGNALWLAFLEQAYGLPALRLTLSELVQNPVAEAFDRGLRRSSGDDLAAAFREFQLWALLVGDRADGQHFSFAGRMDAPRFASAADGLPALSIQADGALGLWGAAQVRLHPGRHDGGLRVHFEGEFPGSWQADLLLVDGRGQLRRLALALSAEGRGDAVIPLSEVSEALLLVRHLGDGDGAPRRYTYTAQHERGYPFELASIAAVVADPQSGAVLVSWETSSEQQLVGFNVLRTRDVEQASPRVVVNPVWVPALGERGRATWYHFIDAAAERGVSYQYRVEGITSDGLSSLSDPVIVRRSRPN